MINQEKVNQQLSIIQEIHELAQKHSLEYHLR